jgi:hypothetical protein
VPLETILAEVAIEGQDMVDSMMVDQRKAGAIDEAEVFVMVSDENRLGRLFDRFANTKNLDAGLVERLHEFNRRLVTDFEANQCVGLGENEIGGKELSFGLKQLRINRCCSGMVTVVLVSQSKECTRIQKYFQSLLIKVLVVIFGEIMKPALKQADDLIGGMSGNTCSTRRRAALGRRFSEPLGRLLSLYHGQLNSLSVFKSHFGERLKHAVFVEGFDAFCHG